MYDLTATELINYSIEDLNRVAKATKMELAFTTIPDEYDIGDFDHAQGIMYYNIEEEYLDLAQSDFSSYEQAIQPGLRDLAVKVFALTYSEVSIDKDVLEQLQGMVTDDFFGSIRSMCDSTTLAFYDALGFTSTGVINVLPLSNDSSLVPSVPYVFVSLNGRDIDGYKHRASSIYKHYTEFSMPDVKRCHTSVMDALRKCNKNGYIYVYDNSGSFIECITLQRSDAMDLINKYLPASHKLSERDIKRYRMECNLASGDVSVKSYLRSRYNASTAITDFMLLVDVHTRTTRLVFIDHSKVTYYVR